MAQPPAHRSEALPSDYPQFLAEVKARVASARAQTALGITLTATTPAELRPALPELPELASELAGITEAAAVVYEGLEPR